ncbi:MAG TPA: hypothetical protein VLK23_03340 [Thermodesulfobacteriota bacterium]|nr:hypothetical protein [Thermodesulfobacteriota bacterium]
MIVIGGHNSGNTQRLASICREIQPCTIYIESAQGLSRRKLANKRRIGLTAGASTPHWIIEEVEETVRGFMKGLKAEKFVFIARVWYIFKISGKGGCTEWRRTI